MNDHQDLVRIAAHKVDWRKVGRFLSYPKPFDESAFQAELREWAYSLKFFDKNISQERLKLKTLALFNYLWESKKEELDEQDDYSYCYRHPMLALLFLETHEWAVPPFFWNYPEDDCLGELQNHPFGYLQHETMHIIGYLEYKGAESGFHQYDGELDWVLSHLKKIHWAGKFEKNAATTLALSFLAQGCEDTLAPAINSGKPAKETMRDMLHGSLQGMSYVMKFDWPKCEWTMRYILFVMAQLLFVRKIVHRPEDCKERHVFSVLYLLFYREGPDKLLSRDSLTREWNSISTEEREQEAASCRQFILRNHKKNALEANELSKVPFAIGFDPSDVISETEVGRFGSACGPCVSCTCTGKIFVENWNEGDPSKFCADLIAKFKGGRVVHIETRTCAALFYGRVDAHGLNQDRAVVTDRRIIAALAKCAADMVQPQEGEFPLPDDVEAEQIIKDLGVPSEPLRKREGIVHYWWNRWTKTGKMCKMTDGEWVIESAIAPEFEVNKVSHYVNGVEVEYPGQCASGA